MLINLSQNEMDGENVSAIDSAEKRGNEISFRSDFKIVHRTTKIYIYTIVRVRTDINTRVNKASRPNPTDPFLTRIAAVMAIFKNSTFNVMNNLS